MVTSPHTERRFSGLRSAADRRGAGPTAAAAGATPPSAAASHAAPAREAASHATAAEPSPGTHRVAEDPLPRFGVVTLHQRPLAAGMACEDGWLADSARSGRAVAHLWSAPRGLVLPRRYEGLPGWPQAMAAASDGRHGELQLRASGGGLVPQGPGVWNLSLAWPAPTATPQATEQVYRGLCRRLADALQTLGIATDTQAVGGAFCDGRYNLAAGGAKLAGTAQAWRRVAGVPVVLAHAVLLVDADPVELTARANAFEAELGIATRYRAAAITTLARAASAQARRPPGIEARALQAIAEAFAQALPLRPNPLPTPETRNGSA